jgi:transposase
MEVESGGNGIECVVGQRRDGKRVYEERFKQAVVDQCLAGEASVASIALSHGINANLVRKWIVKRQRAGTAPVRAQPAPRMLPVMLNSALPMAEAPRAAPRTGIIELELAGGRIRVRGAADLAALRAAIELLR